MIVKNPVDVSWNQKKRAKILLQEKLPADISLIYGDNTVFECNNLQIEISPPVPHGFNTKRGNVIMVRFFDKETEINILFSSDVEGPGSMVARSWILERQTDTLVLDGPAYYHPHVTQTELDFELASIQQVLASVKSVFLEHHFNRALSRNDFSREQFGTILPCASEMITLKPLFLEARRKQLWQHLPWGDSRTWSRQISTILTDPIIEKDCIHELQSYLTYLKNVQDIITPAI